MILDPKFNFKKMIKKTSFQLRPNNQHLELVNPRVADLTGVCHRAWTSLHDIDNDIWPWIMSPISEIDSHNII